MGAIHFYHLTTTPLERALPKLLEKAYGSGARTCVVADSARISRLDELLWTYDPNSFLPHGIEGDQHPILIAGELPAAGDIVCITNGIRVENVSPYNRILDIFDGASEEGLKAARARWKGYKDAGCELHYYQQTSTGGWDKKAA